MAEVRVIRSSDLSEATAQTPGMHRMAAVDRDSVGCEGLWVGRVTVDPGTSTGAHHHGDVDSVIYVIAGRITIRFGDRLEHAIQAAHGDFIYVPANLVHQEINESDSDGVDSIVIRSGDNVVVNVVLAEDLLQAESGD